MTWLREDRWKALEWMNGNAANEFFQAFERQSLLACYHHEDSRHDDATDRRSRRVGRWHAF